MGSDQERAAFPEARVYERKLPESMGASGEPEASPSGGTNGQSCGQAPSVGKRLAAIRHTVLQAPGTFAQAGTYDESTEDCKILWGLMTKHSAV